MQGMGAAPKSGQPSAREAAFIARVSKALHARYPTAAEAQTAGYMRMTPVGKDGTSIFFNHRFSGMDALHPNFLWYDRRGKLMGLDYEYPVNSWRSPPGPDVYPVSPSRWTTVGEHVHFAYRTPAGTIRMRGTRVRPNLKGTIGAAQLRADGLLPSGATFLWAYYHPKCWDLGFWLVRNPSGAFADLNPLVH